MAQYFKNMQPEKALEKAKWYCSFQERCKQHVLNRLIVWNVEKKYFDDIIDKLIDDDFLNETRFAEAFVRGKFNIKNWGRVKITAQLYQLHINKKDIDVALAVIDEEEYFKTLNHLAEKKKEQLKEEQDSNERKAKIFRYLSSKGYESDLIYKLL
jgi:regulatory protein